MFRLMTCAARGSDSISSTSAAPRDSASRPTAPDPAYRSSTAAPCRLPSIASTAANRPSLVRSLVGLVDRPPGTARRRPPAVPAMILVTRSGLFQVLGALRVEQRRDRGGQRRLPRQGGIGPDQFLRLLPGLRRSGPRPCSSVSSFRLDRRPAWAAPSTSPSLRCSRSSLDKRESVLGRCDRVEPFPRRAVRRLGHQQAHTRMTAPADPAAQLVQLRDPEPVRVHDHHGRGVRHVDARPRRPSWSPARRSGRRRTPASPCPSRPAAACRAARPA